MSTAYKEVPEMVQKVQKKDLVWNINGTEYKVLNVPTYKMNAEEEEYYDMEVSIKLSMIKDLMFAKEIPNIVDFNEIADI